MTDLQRHYRQRCIARTDVRLARYSFGFRPIVVPFEANCNSPAASTLSLLGQRGEGVAPFSQDATPAFSDVHNLLHATENARV